MQSFDLVVIAVYLLLTLGVGALASRSAGNSADAYFLGARDLPAWAVMLSIVATETSALTVISVPGIAARGNLTFLQLALGYLLGRIVLAWWLLPGYFQGQQQTAYERLETRFGPGTRRLLSLVFLVTRFLADGVRIFAGAIPLALLTGWDVSWSIVVMGSVTLAYTFVGGLKAVVWADALQLVVYVAGGLAALYVASQMAAELDLAQAGASWWQRAQDAGRLQVFDFSLSPTVPFSLLGGIVGGALMSAASHGTDQIIVQRLLATRSLHDARLALVGSGVLVLLQFGLFLLLGTALWAAGQAPDGLAGDQIFPRFIVQHLPVGLAGLVMAGILAAAMSTISSSISALASSVTHDLYAGLAGRQGDGAHLLRAGRWFSLMWGVLLTAAALGFNLAAGGRDTPVVVLALSIASVTYGALLGAYVLAGAGPRMQGLDVIRGAGAAVLVMLVVVFAGRLASWPGLDWLAPVGKLAFPWYVPSGLALTVGVAALSSRLRVQGRDRGDRRRRV